MSFWLPAAYPWIKSLHIVSMVAWMAGLLYLPRLYVYHSLAPAGSDRSETFKVMERRLQRGIMTPAMIATWMGWIWAKLTFVVGLTIFHIVLARWRGAFAADRNRHPTRLFRIVNELPTVALIAIVILVVIKPF